MPDICFATRHPIKNFSVNDSSILPNLEQLIPRNVVKVGNENTQFNNLTTTLRGEPIRGPLYYARHKGFEVFATQEEAKAGGNAFDIQPLIFYVLKYPIDNLKSLPELD